MMASIQQNKTETVSPRLSANKIDDSRTQQSVSTVKSSHTPPEKFEPGESLTLRLEISGEAIQAVRSVWLRYRHVDQAERWNAVGAVRQDSTYTAVIPAEYTQSKFALEYYFELEDGQGAQWMDPGFNETFSNQPYFAVCKRTR